MVKDIEYPPLVHWISLLKGVLGGSLFAGGLVNNFGPIIQAILVIFGSLIILDGVMVTVKGVFVVICLISATIFGAITVVLSMTVIGTLYLVVIFILAVLLYADRFLKPAGKFLGRKKEHAASSDENK